MSDHAQSHNLAKHLKDTLGRRRFLALAGAGTLSVPILSACSSALEGTGSSVSEGASACVLWPEETNGPYPADGTNNANGSLANVLIASGIVRQDMTTSFAGLTGTAVGVPLRLRMKLVDSTASCASLAGYVVYAWHCDAAGGYSVYNLPEQNYLRAVGVADEDGYVVFDTIYPGCYMGRVPHIHFEAYPSLEATSDFGNRVLCSQIAFPDAISETIYDTVSDYADSIRPFENISLETDNVFADNSTAQMLAQTAIMSGDVGADFQADVTVGIDPDAEPVNAMIGGPDGRPNDRRGPPPEGAPFGPPPDRT